MKLPSLNAVRVFEVAGKLENFSKAAVELNVTPGAVSKQVRNLEKYLGTTLFERIGTEVRLTSKGQNYLVIVQDALKRLEIGTREVSGSLANQPLHICGSRFFLRLWLIPRLPSFHQRSPDQEVMITSTLPNDPMPNSFDVAVLLGRGEWPGYRADLLIRQMLVPVCSPSFLRDNPHLKRPQDLEGTVLLQTPGGADDWYRWYATTSAPKVPLNHRMTFTSTDMAYSAAIDGVGIVLGRRGFFENDIQEGRLVLPFKDYEYHTETGFYLVYKERDPLPKRISDFRAWIGDVLAADSKITSPSQDLTSSTA
ncbi:LysR substrate-binding domain-containing protein [Microvirga sp. P5_D2]